MMEKQLAALMCVTHASALTAQSEKLSELANAAANDGDQHPKDRALLAGLLAGIALAKLEGVKVYMKMAKGME